MKKAILLAAVQDLCEAAEPTAGHYQAVLRALEGAYKQDTGHDCRVTLDVQQVRRAELRLVQGGAV